MIVERYHPDHLKDLVLQPAQEYARASVESKDYCNALSHSEAYSAFVNGRVVACIGVVPVWEGRGDAWALIARDIGPMGMHKLHFAVRKLINASPLRRIEACCDAGFEQAHRWLLLLGFGYEGPLRKYTPDGRDCLRFARVR